MPPSAPLIIGPDEDKALADLVALANDNVVHVPALIEDLKTSTGQHAHREQMERETIVIPGPWPFHVTFSLETGHSCGMCRHMSMSIDRPGRMPNEHALWLVAQSLGFIGRLEYCAVYVEDLRGGGHAVNVVQPMCATLVP